MDIVNKTVIVNAHVISPGVDIENATIVVEGKKVKQVIKGSKPVKPDAKTTVVDVRGQYVMPGFIDVHTHGALGYDFCDADPKAVFEIKQIIRSLAKMGIGVLLTDHNVRDALSITTKSHIISEGRILVSGGKQELLANEIARDIYFGDSFEET